MTEETTTAPITDSENEQNNVTTNDQTGNTEQTPAWKIKADEMAKQIGNGFWVQMAYMSNSDNKCVPVLLSEQRSANIYPLVVDAPVGFVDPIFDWGKDIWVENDSKSQAQKIASLAEDVKELQGNLTAFTQQKSVADENDDHVFKLITAMNVQLGVINAKLDQVAKPVETTTTNANVSATTTNTPTTATTTETTGTSATTTNTPANGTTQPTETTATNTDASTTTSNTPTEDATKPAETTTANTDATTTAAEGTTQPEGGAQ